MARAKRFHVLVATDGSAPARAALATALSFPWPAEAGGSAVVAKQVRADYRRSILLAALDRTSEVNASRASRAMSKRWADGAAQVVDAEPIDGILKEARRLGADVIVMGWRGHGAVRRLLTGSVSRGVVRRASCSVLVVRRPLRDLRRIVVAYDGSPHAERALAFLAALTPKRGTRATLFRAVETMAVPTQGLIPADTRGTVAAEVRRINDERRTKARQELARAAKTLSAAGWRVDEVVTEGAPLRELLATVQKVRADLVVLGAKGVTGLRHLLLGSVAEGALNRSPAPVLVVR
ncbi:MAG TPA: universal stress protein [Vicinamibacterales bacterium]